MKLRIFVIAILLFAGVSQAQIWGKKNGIPVNRNKQYNRALDYSVVTADSVANRIGLFTVQGCPDVIYVPLRSVAATDDTIIFLQPNCVSTSRTESIWIAQGSEIEDSTQTVSVDQIVMSQAVDTIFITKSTTGSGGVDWVYLFRIR